MRILAINPGSTSTKIAVYDDDKPLLVKSIPHSSADLKRFPTVQDQYEFRKELILAELAAAGIPLQMDAVIGRGPLAKPVQGGVYEVNEQMCSDARHAEHQHACDLGCILAYDIARQMPGCLSLMADPGSVDELIPEARITGSPIMPRMCIWHALNHKAIARRHAASIGKKYEDLNLIICHLGGGISVVAHERGLAIDAPNCLDGEGPFSPERAGALPVGALIHLCYSGKYTEQQLLRRVAGQAGLAAHLGMNDMRQIMELVEGGDAHAKLLVDAMCYQTAKAIAAQGAVLRGRVDAILLTGGMAHSQYIVDQVSSRVDWIAPISVYPGENEMDALASNALGVLRGTLPLKSW